MAPCNRTAAPLSTGLLHGQQPDRLGHMATWLHETETETKTGTEAETEKPFCRSVWCAVLPTFLSQVITIQDSRRPATVTLPAAPACLVPSVLLVTLALKSWDRESKVKPCCRDKLGYVNMFPAPCSEDRGRELPGMPHVHPATEPYSKVEPVSPLKSFPYV